MNIDRRLTTAVAACILAAGIARGQQPAEPPQQPMFDDSIEAAEAPDEPPQRKVVAWNHYEGKYATIKFGASAMYDIANYVQDNESIEQVGDLDAAGKWRDFRVVFSGKFPRIKRDITWKAGVMYDGPSATWLIRETGLIIAVPEMSGHLFIGRTKEGFSMVKHMVGTSIWGLERSPFLDAAIPIMADGIRWMGYKPERNFVWNLGLYNEHFSQSRHAPYYNSQAVARAAWLPFSVPEKGELLHLGFNARYALPQDDKLTFRARPEAITAPYYIDTGSFPAKHTTTFGPEIYWRRNSLIVGSEYYFEKFSSPETHNPTFQGGDVTAIWMITGESRPYLTRGGLFGFAAPSTSVFKGGPGAWEAMLRLSYTDADSGTVTGGKLWRISPILTWYLSDQVRWTIGYGYSELDRFGVTGATQFFQSRIHVQF
jgi:phosphate-selective porin OprO/OprP